MNVAPALRQIAAAEPGIDLLVLFGSHASGQATGTSDVDLGVRWASGVEPAHQSQVLARLERAVGTSVDPIPLDAAPPLLRMEIARHGIVLCERAPGSWSGFVARAMLDWWDFAPWARRMQQAARARLEAAVRGAR